MNAPHPTATTYPPPKLPVRRRKGRWGRWLIGLLLLGAAAYYLRTKIFASGADAVRYQTAPVVRRHLREIVSASGTLNPIVSVTVGAEVTGVIRKVLVDYNSPVKAGQAVAQIDTADYQAALTQAEGDLANAESSLKLAEANLKRKEALHDQKMLAPSDYDTAVATVEQARATVITRQGARDKSKTDLEHCTIYSPIDGVVTSRAVDVGQTVASSFSTPTLFTIVNDLRKMQIDASVAEADIGGVTVDQPVAFTVDAYPTITFHGKVKQVHNAPTSTTSSSSSSTTSSSSSSSSTTGVVTYDTVIEVDNAGLKLKPGMTASVSIVISDRENAVAVPNAALRFTPASAAASPAWAEETETGQAEASDVHRVYLPRDGSSGVATELAPRDIKTGISDGAYTEVLAGLQAGARVVVAVLHGDSKASGFGGPPPGGGPH
jgi:HlyD family secretion protein